MIRNNKVDEGYQVLYSHRRDSANVMAIQEKTAQQDAKIITRRLTNRNEVGVSDTDGNVQSRLHASTPLPPLHSHILF